VIYDVGEYIQIHPGGQSYLRNQIGNEVSEVYEQVGHSKHAQEIMRHLPEIGTIRGAKLRP
jgi:cytochrome b involved in lipid metabolism